jgi:ribosome maturation factor RimP
MTQDHTHKPLTADAPGAHSAIKANSREALSQIERDLSSLIHSLGYEIVAVELLTAGVRTLRVYIDFLNNGSDFHTMKRISLEDCMAVNRAIDPYLDETTLIDGTYNLEVSSPGVERPLKKDADFARFAGNRVRVGTFRPLTGVELNNETYWVKNKKQKNFIGELLGLTVDGGAIRLIPEGYKPANGGPAEVTIPMDLVAKANLDFIEPLNKAREK